MVTRWRMASRWYVPALGASSSHPNLTSSRCSRFSSSLISPLYRSHLFKPTFSSTTSFRHSPLGSSPRHPPRHPTTQYTHPLPLSHITSSTHRFPHLLRLHSDGRPRPLLRTDRDADGAPAWARKAPTEPLLSRSRMGTPCILM